MMGSVRDEKKAEPGFFASLMAAAPAASDVKNAVDEAAGVLSAAAQALLPQTKQITDTDIRQEIEAIFNPDTNEVKQFWEAQIPKIDFKIYKFFFWGQDVGDVMNGIPSGVADIVISLFKHVKETNKSIARDMETPDLFNKLRDAAQMGYDRNSVFCTQPTRDIYRIMKGLNNTREYNEGGRIIEKKWEDNRSYIYQLLVEWRKNNLPSLRVQNDEKAVTPVPQK